MNQRRRLRRIILGTVLLSTVVVCWNYFPISSQLEQMTLDFRYVHFSRPTEFPRDVVFIDIDETSLKALEGAPDYGRWPWPRKSYKGLLEFLALGEPAHVLFDILFTERSRIENDDAELGELSRNLPFVSHGLNMLTVRTQGEGLNPLPISAIEKMPLSWKEGATRDIPLGKHTFIEYLLPTADIFEGAQRLHTVNFEHDSDGQSRHSRLIFKYGDTWVPSLVLAGVMSKLQEPRISYGHQKLHLEDKTGKSFHIPLDSTGRMTIHFYGKGKDPDIIPFNSVLESAQKIARGEEADPTKLTVNPFEFKDKVIIIGGSAPGLADLKATPMSPAFPGPLLHATAIANILHGDHLKSIPQWMQILIGLIIVGITYYFLFAVENMALKIAVPTLISLVYGVTSLYAFKLYSFHLPLAMPLSAMFIALIDGFAYLTFVEGKERKKLKGTLSKYLSPTVVESLVSSGKDIQAEVGTRKEISILFSDIRGFTTLSEKLPAETIVSTLNMYLDQMTNVIFDHQGTLDKFIGDAIMAFWGAPIDSVAHAHDAVTGAFAMQKALRELKAKHPQHKELQLLEVGLGINTGEAIVGNIGGEKRLDYTVIGDNVNLASRLEGLTKQYSVGLLIGERTEEMVRTKWISRRIDLVKVKGKNKPISIFEPLCPVGAPEENKMRALAQSFSNGMDLYRSGDFPQAIEVFKKINDGASRTYVERCEELIMDPPEKWDGVFTAKSK